jgi:hypothetical protein
MPYKITWTFQQANGATFNEVYYSGASTANLALATKGSVTARLALLHPTCKFVSSRASNVLQLRDTATITQGFFGTAIGAVSGPMAAGDAVVCSLSGSGGGSRRLWLRGCPKEFQVRDNLSGQDKPPAQLTNALSTFFKKLQADGYGLLRISQSVGADAFAPNPIIKVDGTAGDGTSIITTKNAPLFVTGDLVIIARVNRKDTPALSGRWKTILVNNPAGTFIIPYRTPLNQLILTAGGYVKKLAFQPVSVFDASACDFHHYGTRTTENPTTHSRGARRAVRLRTSP